MRYLIREVQPKDIKELLKLSQQFPLYNLPNNKILLKQKIKQSQKSFNKTLQADNRNYIFVLEDLQKKQVVASCQILAFVSRQNTYCWFWNKKVKKPYLKLTAIKAKRQELGGLILDSRYRNSVESLGLQVGASRFLYIKTHPKDFFKTFEVSLTAPLQKEDNPFWQETGAQYIKQNYIQALKTFRSDDMKMLKAFPKDLKIPVESLSSKAQLCLSHVHPQTVSVYKGLIKRGFSLSGYHHLLDGGIYLRTTQTSFIKKAQSYILKFEKQIKGKEALIGQQGLKGFICAKVPAQKKGNVLKISANHFFEEGHAVLALDFPC